jgi:SAM-dependent methyltransferase
LTSLSTFKDKAFAQVWKIIGGPSYEKGKPHVGPLLQQARGTVLDIGTGTGHWLHFYDRSKVTKIYAVEPNPGQHAQLRQSAKDAGLQDIFEVIAQPVEALQAQAGIKKGSIDTVVTVQVLCSISDHQGVIKELYEYLKPGGQWLVFEHVLCRPSAPVWRYQGRRLIFSDGLDTHRNPQACSTCSGRTCSTAAHSAGTAAASSKRPARGAPPPSGRLPASRRSTASRTPSALSPSEQTRSSSGPGGEGQLENAIKVQC